MTERRPRSIHEYRNAVLSRNGPGGGQARCVAVALAQFMDSKTLETIVGIPTLAVASGFCERTVRTELRALRAGGWIAERTKGRGHPVIRAASLPALIPEATTLAPRAAPPRQDMPEVTPANGSGNPGTRLPGTPAPRAAYLDQNLEKNLGAASPSPVDTVSAALEARADEVMRLHSDGLAADAIAKRLRHDWNVQASTRQVVQLIAKARATS